MSEQRLTKRQSAIVSAYTGILAGNFPALHEYVEEKFGHPVWTHQFGDEEFADKLKELSREDFLGICNNE